MKITLDLHDPLFADAKALAAGQHISLTRLIEEALQWRLQAEAAPRHGKVRLPVFEGQGGPAPGVDPLNNKAMLEASGG